MNSLNALGKNDLFQMPRIRGSSSFSGITVFVMPAKETTVTKDDSSTPEILAQSKILRNFLDPFLKESRKELIDSGIECAGRGSCSLFFAYIIAERNLIQIAGESCRSELLNSAILLKFSSMKQSATVRDRRMFTLDL
jgi:hypothetical protein